MRQKEEEMRRNRNRFKVLFGVAAVLCVLAAVCLLVSSRFMNTADSSAEETSQQTEEEPETTVEIAETPDINDLGINEDESVYDQDDPDSIVYFYVTVRRGDKGSDTDHTFDEVKSAVRFVDNSHVSNDIYARALVQAGDETGPLWGMIGYGEEETNATIRIRGNSSTVMPQKSYQLKLDSEAGLWRGQRNIALNKSAFDLTKFRNKLYFDLLKEVEGVPSIRTQFARLFIKDETAGKTEFEDYGFYTQAEVPNKRYLANHGLDREGYLYKAVSFNFEPSDALKNFDDPAFDQEAFDAILDCKGRQDNEKLINLVDMISDLSIDINDIIGTYIDRENYITWLAYNILMANIDTTVQNFYLYSPSNGEKWFFIPWDGDNMLPWGEYQLEGATDSYGEYQTGISNYWGVLLHQRFLKYEENREELAAKVDELHTFINRDTVNAKAQEYNETVESWISQMPDLYYLGGTLEEREQIISGLGEEVETAYEEFYQSLDSLMPFFLQAAQEEGDTLVLNWDEAYDFDNEEISYRVIVSEYPDMRTPLIDEEVEGIRLETSKEVLPEGTYYWTVQASTPSGKTAEPMNKIEVRDVWYPGVDILEVQE